MIGVRAGASSDTGQVRQNNQDTSLVADADGLWAVADGMGGHRGGEVASALAIETLREAYTAGLPTEEGLLDAAAAANIAVHDVAEDDPDLRGMGTTLVAVARTEDGDLAFINVGDSRIYLLRDGELEQLTIDHSLVEEMVREGRITPEEALTHPKRNIVTRALGISPWVQVDSDTITPVTGDRFLLCSDGLFNEVEEDRIASVLRRLADPADAASELVRLANESGGRDNITAVVVDVTDDEDRAAKASALVDSTAAGAAAVAAGVGSGAGAPPRTRSLRRRRDPDAPKPPRRITWRVVAFVLVLVAILGAGVAAISSYARGTYYVGTDGDTVVIYKGKPDGVLWFEPTLEETTELQVADLPAEARDDVARGIEFGDLDEAEAYIDRYTTTTTTTTTSTTTTTTTTTTSTTTTTAAPPPAPPP
jgi:protein phosphatase